MPISTFARLAASGLALGLLVTAGPGSAQASPKPVKSVVAPKATKVAATSRSSGSSASASSRAAKARPTPAATGSLAKDVASSESAPTPAPGVTWTSAEPDELRCGRSRRKLWQPGEGWVVKTVTVCR